ncbi:MAG: hypothetical protein K2K45_03690 [Muribaculaceae bacterium]|nr:hypothetical protein [Muribaculaceae bacterium]
MRKRPNKQKNTGSSFTVAMHPTNSTPDMIAVNIVTYWLYLTLDFIILHKFSAKLQIISDISKENFKVIDFENAPVTDFATFAGGKQLDVAPAFAKIVSQGDTIS